MSWVLQRRSDGLFWAGWPRANGSPRVVIFAHEAKHFSTAVEANAAASTHPDLAFSDDWHVVRRQLGGERTQA